MNIIDRYVDYIRTVRRYSDRTVAIYESVLYDFADAVGVTDDDEVALAATGFSAGTLSF